MRNWEDEKMKTDLHFSGSQPEPSKVWRLNENWRNIYQFASTKLVLKNVKTTNQKLISNFIRYFLEVHIYTSSYCQFTHPRSIPCLRIPKGRGSHHKAWAARCNQRLFIGGHHGGVHNGLCGSRLHDWGLNGGHGRHGGGHEGEGVWFVTSCNDRRGGWMGWACLSLNYDHLHNRQMLTLFWTLNQILKHLKCASFLLHLFVLFEEAPAKRDELRVHPMFNLQPSTHSSNWQNWSKTLKLNQRCASLTCAYLYSL